jgi:hypothetical protein
MKHLLAAAVTFALLGCSSNSVKIIPPDLEIVQLVGPAELNYPTGPIDVQYGVRIANRSSEPITLRQIQLQQVSAGGPYRVRSETYFFNKPIAPGAFEELTFWAHADARGGAFATDAQAPVNVRGVAFFESKAGSFRKIFLKTFDQMGGARRPG